MIYGNMTRFSGT